MGNTFKITDPKLIKKLTGPFRVKCLSCRNEGDGKTINDAHTAVKHHENCSYVKGAHTLFDSIDLSMTNHF